MAYFNPRTGVIELSDTDKEELNKWKNLGHQKMPTPTTDRIMEKLLPKDYKWAGRPFGEAHQEWLDKQSGVNE